MTDSRIGPSIPCAKSWLDFLHRTLAGVEEQWRDNLLWLVTALRPLLETRCFYYCLREHCQADDARVERVTEILHKMRIQLFGIQEHLKYCSPLGGVLKNLQRTQASRIGSASIRRLEAAGIISLAGLVMLSEDQLIQMGLRRDAARALVSYVRRRSA